MKSGLVIAFGLAVSIGSASAASTPSPAEILNDLARATNSGDLQAAEGLFASSPTIVDSFAPFSWQGTDAVDKWWNGFARFSKRHGMSNIDVKLSAPLVTKFDREKDDAYVVVPGVITGTMNGSTFRMTGRNTGALTLTPAGWRIVVWTWTDDPQ